MAKTKLSFFKIIPLVLIGTISSCVVSVEGKLTSTGVTDEYAYEKEDETKATLKYTYHDLYNNYIYNIDDFPATGNPKLLVIPVWFKDSDQILPNNKEEVRNDIYRAFFGNESDTGWRSVAGFYKQESMNKLNITGTVSPWFECNYYATEITDENKTMQLVEEATNWYSKSNSDYKDFDTDQDGYLDGVALIYAAPDYAAYEESGGRSRYSDNMWAYSYWIQDEAISGKVIPNSFMWASYDFMYDSMWPRYGNYGYGDCSHLTIDTHTYIHEMGHILGLSDYYDYASNYPRYEKVAYNAAGVFSMQDNNVGGHDPFSKMALGWISPYVVTETSTITIQANQESGDVILLSPKYEESAFDEYLLIELYTPTGLNKQDAKYPYQSITYKGPDAYGCRLWHVDSRVSSPLYSKSKGYYYNDASSVTNNPTKKTENGFELAVSNTTKTNDSSLEAYASPVPGFGDYRLLQLIRKGKANYKCGDTLSSSDLFVAGDTFDMTTYANAFKNKGIFNNGLSLDYSIYFDEVTPDYAKITFTKL